MIGEAPGSLEDRTGYPFVGKSGTILEQILKRVHFQFEYLITNVVGCRPVDLIFLDQDLEQTPPETLSGLVKDEDYELYNWNRAPTKTEKELCKPHIDELVETFKPHGVVYVGQEARSYKTKLPSTEIFHPAYIARMEYKFVPVLKQARKIDEFLHTLHEMDKANGK